MTRVAFLTRQRTTSAPASAPILATVNRAKMANQWDQSGTTSHASSFVTSNTACARFRVLPDTSKDKKESEDAMHKCEICHKLINTMDVIMWQSKKFHWLCFVEHILKGKEVKAG